MVGSRRSSSSSKHALSSPPPTTAKRSKIAVKEVLSEPIWPHFAIANIGSGFSLIDAFRLVELLWKLINQRRSTLHYIRRSVLRKSCIDQIEFQSHLGKASFPVLSGVFFFFSSCAFSEILIILMRSLVYWENQWRGKNYF
ncbi:uncharacterized protein LOC108994572 [Juglans regia]|uniref:Uncharacterized protein LOC108994572 n=1 Tax=Juglans regia TaxID=51240 RepID=A0A2I4F146_JUGRE|nr:uncharacterized protein LOC108994572 [Juglans regia]